jgi:hypothetical protein
MNAKIRRSTGQLISLHDLILSSSPVWPHAQHLALAGLAATYGMSAVSMTVPLGVRPWFEPRSLSQPWARTFWIC